jgi:dipeptidyl aminopeptidase/acylaminoacyl peptidase
MQKKFLLSTMLLSSFCIFFAGCAFAQQQPAKHPFTVFDMLAMERISDSHLSPDGKFVAFVVQKIDLNADKAKSNIWLVAANGQDLRQLTTSPENDSNPRWGLDSKTIWFLSSGSGSSQVWKIAIDGSETQQITNLPIDVANLIVAPDGKYIAFSAEVFPDCNSIETTKKKLDEIKNRKTTGRIYDHIFVRHWDAWEDGRRSHLFVMPSDGNRPVDIMAGMDADCPSQPFGSTEEFCFTPDGKNIIFTARDVGRKEPWSTDLDLYLSPIDGSVKPACLTDKNEATDTAPLFSPDGKTLAYLAMSRPGYESDRLKIILQPWPDGKEKVLAENWDRSPASISWSKDSKKIYAVAENIGQKSLFAIDVQIGKVQTIVENGSVTGAADTGDRIIFGWDSFKSPLELYSVKTDGSDLKPLTQINRERLSSISFGEFEQFSFKGWNNETVFGFVVKPVDYKEGIKYPVAFLIHGGPQGTFNNTFHYRWNSQIYAAAGFGVVMVDFHGSTGYGQKFCDSIRGDWGGKPLLDLQEGLEAAIKKYPWLDADRAGALGASFGGYMINWIEGNWPDRFRCLVNHAGSLDERMSYFDTEELWFTEWDHLGLPWENPQSYEKQNPVNFIQNWKTPMLVIHGGKDFRVSETQGLGTFNALQRKDIPSKLLYFPNECHWVLKPGNCILWHQTVLSWLNQWLK